MEQHPEQQSLLRNILANPYDDVARLVYADWLQEHGDEDRAEFIRVQIEASTLECEWETLDGLPCRSFNENVQNYRTVVLCPSCNKHAVLAIQEHKLLSKTSNKHLGNVANRWQWLGDATHETTIFGSVPVDIAAEYLVFRRGFLGQIACSYEDWEEWGDDVLNEHPIRRVVLTTIPSVERLMFVLPKAGLTPPGERESYEKIISRRWPGPAKEPVEYQLPWEEQDMISNETRNRLRELQDRWLSLQVVEHQIRNFGEGEHIAGPDSPTFHEVRTRVLPDWEQWFNDFFV